MSEPAESKRLGTLGALARNAVESPTPAELERGFQVLRARTHSRSRKSPVSAKRVAVLALGALLVVASVAFWSIWPFVEPKPIAVQRVQGGKLLEGGYLAEQGRSGMELQFTEGSRFMLMPGARGRLRAVSAEGAHFALDHGSAAFRITPDRKGRWRIEAGPFVVSVRGTDFSVVWEPTSERFEVRLREGRVAISGPVVGDELVLRPGQNLAVDLPKGETVISEAWSRASAPVASPSSEAAPVVAPSLPASVPSPSVSASARTTSTSSGSGAERGFREALANGQWDRILAEVEREGVDASVRKLSSDDLFALADAARYRRRIDVARAALLAQRARFPNSSRSLDALFLLGRAEEARAGGREAAIARYDEYLLRAPGGTYAAEALGRKMILAKEVEGPESARRVATEYLRRFPSGSYSEAARRLQQLP